MAIKKLQGLDAIRRWVVKTFLKEKEQTGVMVNLPKKDFVDLNTSITAERLMRNGVDPNSIKSVDQVENIINQLNKPKVVSQGDPEFEGIMSKMLGSNVIKRDFGKPFKEEIKKMKSDEEIVSNIKKSNERSVQNLRMQMLDDKVANDMFQGGPSRDPKTDADMLAEFIAEDAGKIYDDLPTKERLKFYDRAYNAILRYKRKDPEDMADGGRIGYKLGGFKNLFDFFNKKNPIQAYRDYLKSIKDRMKAGKEAEVAGEVIPIAAGGGLLTNQLKKKLEKMNEEQKKKIEEQAQEELKKDMEKKADGGRIGFKKGMDRRTFMKMVGGLTALPILGKFFKGAEVAAPVVEKAVDVASGAPPYFFDLVNKIKIFGKQRQTPSYKERVNEYTYQGKDGIEYELVEDLDTGDIKITKDKIGGANYGDESYDVIEDRTEMVYKKGQADETTKGTPADEYDEYKVEFDQDGTAADATEIDEVSKMEIIKEVSGDAPPIKKASGGVARMLGE